MALEPPTTTHRTSGPEIAMLVREGHPARQALAEMLRASLATLPGGPWRITIREQAVEGLMRGGGVREMWTVEITARGACALTLVRPDVESPAAVVRRIRAILGG